MTGQPLARLHWEDNSLKPAFVCICMDLETRNFSLVQFLTVPQMIFWLRQKASHVRNQPNKDVDVSTVLSSKSYWHFHRTVFLSNAHSDPEPCHLPHPWRRGRAVCRLTAQNLEGFAHAVKLISKCCCSEMKTLERILCLHFSANIWISRTPKWVTISSELLCLPPCSGSLSSEWATGFHSLSCMCYGYLSFYNGDLRIKVLW